MIKIKLVAEKKMKKITSFFIFIYGKSEILNYFTLKPLLLNSVTLISF